MSAALADPTSPQWLTRVLRSAGALAPGVAVEAVTSEAVGTGQMSRLSRLALALDGPGPATVMLKEPAPTAEVREFARNVGLYAREVGFYRDLGQRLPVAAPRSLYHDISEDGGRFILLFEDLFPARVVDQIGGCTLEDASDVLAEAARIHAASWDGALGDLAWLPGGDALWRGAAAQLPALRDAFVARLGDRLEREEIALADRLAEEIGAWLGLLDDRRCLSHGDFRLDNLLFGARDGATPVAVVDWQTVTLGPPMLDVAYFLGSALTPERRRESEEELLRGYHARLTSGGAVDYSWQDCRRDYRAHTICGFLGAMIGAARAEPSERGDAMLIEMARRHAAQVLDCDAFAACRR